LNEGLLPSEWNAETLMQLHLSFAPSRIVAAAVQLKVFSSIAAGHRDASGIARATGASERGMRMLLDALVAMGLLTKADEQVELTQGAARHLVRESPDYVGAVMEMETDMTWAAWGKLTEAVRSGNPVRAVNQRQAAERFFPSLIRSLHVYNREPARRMAQALCGGPSARGMRVLDVACGSAVWSIAIAETDSEAYVTANDFPPVLELTREYVRRHGVEWRYEFLPGNLREVDFGAQRFNLAILGNIVHSEGADSSRELFRRLHRALVPGGRIAIVDMIPNDERSGPYYPVMFALNMLVNTEAGGTYTLAEYRQWLNQAGFAQVETTDFGWHSPLIVGTKA
jgi:ubiquinone/menaquinone biosynthesis C-methylase UbiE